MKHIQLFEQFVNEAKQTETQRMDGKDAVFMGAGKYNNKIGQISIESDDSITLVMPRGKYIVNVDKNDLRLVESINEASKDNMRTDESTLTEGSAGRMELLTTGKYKDVKGKTHTLKKGQIGKHERVGWDGDFIHFGSLVFSADVFDRDDLEVYESVVTEGKDYLPFYTPSGLDQIRKKLKSKGFNSFTPAEKKYGYRENNAVFLTYNAAGDIYGKDTENLTSTGGNKVVYSNEWEYPKEKFPSKSIFNEEIFLIIPYSKKHDGNVITKITDIDNHIDFDKDKNTNRRWKY